MNNKEWIKVPLNVNYNLIQLVSVITRFQKMSLDCIKKDLAYDLVEIQYNQAVELSSTNCMSNKVCSFVTMVTFDYIYNTIQPIP